MTYEYTIHHTVNEREHCMIKRILMTMAVLMSVTGAYAQELQAKININHSQVGVTDVSVFENLKQTLEQFVNERQWTELQFQKNERIVCNFNIPTTFLNVPQ